MSDRCAAGFDGPDLERYEVLRDAMRECWDHEQCDFLASRLVINGWQLDKNPDLICSTCNGQGATGSIAGVSACSTCCGCGRDPWKCKSEDCQS